MEEPWENVSLPYLYNMHLSYATRNKLVHWCI